MLKIRYIFFSFLLCLFNLTNAQRIISVIVSNIEEPSGEIYISVFNNKHDFLAEGKEYEKVTLNAEIPEVSYKFLLPEGEYAIAVYHDVNSDGVCNRTKLGIPIEPFGFSNNIRPRLKAPSFNQAKIAETSELIIIRLINY